MGISIPRGIDLDSVVYERAAMICFEFFETIGVDQENETLSYGGLGETGRLTVFVNFCRNFF